MTNGHDEVMADQSRLLTWINPCLTKPNTIFIDLGSVGPRKGKRRGARKARVAFLEVRH
jgi:hypothetical protein